MQTPRALNDDSDAERDPKCTDTSLCAHSVRLMKLTSDFFLLKNIFNMN